LKDEEAQTEMVQVAVQESVDKGGHTCEICKITFEDIRMYMVHESSHSRDDPWRCRVCGQHKEGALGLLVHTVLHQ